MSTPTQQLEHLTVVGEALHHVPPDIADLRLGVLTLASTATQTLRENATRMLHLVQTLTSMGIGQEQVRTVGLNLYPQPRAGSGYPDTPWFPGMPSEGGATSTYLVSSAVVVTVRDTNRVGEVLDAAVAAGANGGVALTWRIGNEQAARRAALEVAVSDARAKAQLLAASLGRQLGDAVLASEEYSGVLLGSASVGALPVGVSSPSPAVSSQPEEVTVRAAVRVAFQLKP
jgi:uncharacterized protein YggE